jgi:hypothetical protein
MAIYDFFLSRNGSASTPENYVGHTGRLFYDSATGEIRISDGVTPGGNPIPITVATTTTVGGVKPGAGFTVTAGGTLGLNAGPMFELDGSDVFQLKAGTASRIGGIKAGSGVNISSDGTLAINLDDVEAFSFGDFTATVGTYTDSTEYALLSSVKEDEDIVIASNGTGTICVVGAFEIHATNGDVTGSLETEPFFKIKDDGQVRILVPLADTQEGGVEIIGSDLGTALLPGIAGTMLHLTGNADESTRVYHDTLGDYSSYVFRRYNGSVATPTAVLADEDIGRINFTAATSSGMGNVATAQISVTALENQTPTAQGSSITFTVTPVGSAASSRVDILNIISEGLIPSADDTFTLGNADFRWSSIHLGPGTIFIEDTTDPNTIAELRVTAGVLTIDGANQLQVGQLKFVDNTIESKTPDIDIQIGDLAATADIVLNRNVVLGTGKTITGDLTGNADTATTATNLTAATSILAGTLNVNPPAIGKNGSATATYTITGLTTNHKVVVMPQAALPNEFNITASWASATNTLSIQYQTYGGGVDAAAFDIAYWAWV